MKLIFWDNSFTARDGYIEPVEYLLVENKLDMDELQIVVADDLSNYMMSAFVALAIEDPYMKFFAVDNSSVSVEYGEDGIAKTNMTLYDPIFILNLRCVNRQVFEGVSLETFVRSLISGNTSGDRTLGTIDISAITGLSAYTVSRQVDGENLADLLIEEFKARDIKLYAVVSVEGGLSIKLGMQNIVTNPNVMLSRFLGNMGIGRIATMNNFETTIVAGEYDVDGDPVPMRGIYTFGGSGILREEYFVASEKNNETMTMVGYQNYLTSEAKRIAKKRRLSYDILVDEYLTNALTYDQRYNRAGVIFAAEINTDIKRFLIEEVKQTQDGISFSVEEYWEV